MERIGLIGFGNMGEAIVNRLLKNTSDFEITICEKKEERIVTARERYGLPAFKNNKSLLKESDLIVIAVKPQDIDSLLQDISGISAKEHMERKGIISIAAGISIEYISKKLKTKNIARLMPNIAAKVGKAFTAISFSADSDLEFREKVSFIGRVLGTTLVVPEEIIPAITGISGSGIAYVFKFIEAMTMGGVLSGIPYKDSLDITIQVVQGAIEILKTYGKDTHRLITEVTSPGGTTVSGLRILEKSGFNGLIMDAIKSATERAKELEA